MRKTQISKKQKATIVGGSIAALVMGGTAFAYWTAGGEGTGSADTGTGAGHFTVTQTSTVSNMFPGDAPQTLSGTVTNDSGESAYVTRVVVSISGVSQASGAAGSCDASDYTLANETMAVGKDVAKGGQANFGGATIKFNNKTTNQDGCKGATVNLAYAAS